MKRIIFVNIIILLINNWLVAQSKLTLLHTPDKVDVYGTCELVFSSRGEQGKNPFKDAVLSGVFIHESGKCDTIEGFCDSPDGRVYKVRYMPPIAGNYRFVARYTSKKYKQQISGKFIAVSNGLPGPLRVDKEYPWHMVLEGTGSHFFWNSTTTYWMMGWKDEQIIRSSIDRLSSYGINRIRVAINARQDDGQRWYEPLVKESGKFTFKLTPWIAERPEDLDNPGFDVTRFNIAHWQKLDRLVEYARSRNIIVSLIFYVDGLDHGCDPFKKDKMGNDDEQLYYRYAAARYSGYSNIMWDVTNEYHLFRSEEWVNKMGSLLKKMDPAKHLISVHGHSDFPFRTSSWVDIVLYQSWDVCGGYEFIRSCREKQAATGVILPQVNEEYGYEDHYPPWGCGYPVHKVPDSRSAENRAKLAWEICMAGGYQTTGERANEGTGAGNDSGGGWINGRGNNSMTMLSRYKIMKSVFEKTEFWKMDPHQELVNFGNMCLANPGNEYLVYARVPNCRIILPQNDEFEITMINPETGDENFLEPAKAETGAWEYPKSLKGDWIFILRKRR